MLQGPHVVQAVGKLDENDADVVDHRQHHLAETFRLTGFRGIELEAAQLGDALDTAGDFGAEPALDLRNADPRVFDYIVKQPCRNADGIQPHVREQMGDFDWVNQIRLAGFSLLMAVLGGREINESRNSVRSSVGRCCWIFSSKPLKRSRIG